MSENKRYNKFIMNEDELVKTKEEDLSDEAKKRIERIKQEIEWNKKRKG